MRKFLFHLFLLLILTRAAFAQDAALNGDIKEYDDNGKIKSEKNYRNGRTQRAFS